MPQIEIDPANMGALVNGTPIAALSRSVIRFGHIPDWRQCLPGDVILFRDAAPGLASRIISYAQGASHPERDARWTHAAVYLYDDQIVEAVPYPGVRTRSLYDEVPKRRTLRVRRRPGLTVDQRYVIALRALSMLHSRYSFTAAVGIGWRSLGDGRRVGAMNFGPVIICSKVVSDAYLEITRHLFQGCSPDRPVTPADLSATADLSDVQVPWFAIV
jgi:hypothetical protein